MWKLSLSILLIFTLNLNLLAQEDQLMDNELMDEIIREKADRVEGEKGVWQVHLGERILLVITDESNNRMRIFTPILEEKDIEPGDLNKMLEANFHSALDAKYGLYNEYVVSLFTHPLRELTKPAVD